MRSVIALIALVWFGQALAAPTAEVFVSFSMPKNLLEQTLEECARLKVPAYLTGLYHDSMPETAMKIMDMSKRVPGLNLQIDPTRFERFGIQQVPALVVVNDTAFDVIYGHLSIRDGLLRITSRGDSGLTVQDFRRITGE